MKRSGTITSQSGKRVKQDTSLTTKKSYVRAPASTRQELKRAATAIIPYGTGVSTGGNLFVFPRVAAGDEDDEREGRTIKVRGIQVIGTATAVNPVSDCVVRIISFLWNQALVVPTIPDILEFTAAPAFYGTYNISQANNYTILDDRTLNVSATGEQTRPWHLQKNISFIQNYFGPALTEQSDKAIYILVCTSANDVTVSAHAATTFVDM